MPTDPFSQLEDVIVATARERNKKNQKALDDLALKEQMRDAARAVWARRKVELPGLVKTIDAMLREHGFAGVAMGAVELKHSDLDRALVEFEHSTNNHSRILLCVTRAGDFTCTIGAVGGEAGSTKLPIAELTADRFKEVLAEAIMACLGGERLKQPA